MTGSQHHQRHYGKLPKSFSDKLLAIRRSNTAEVSRNAFDGVVSLVVQPIRREPPESWRIEFYVTGY